MSFQEISVTPFGEAVREARKALVPKCSLRQMAERVGCSPSYLSGLEADRPGFSPGIETLESLMRECKLSPAAARVFGIDRAHSLLHESARWFSVCGVSVRVEAVDQLAIPSEGEPTKETDSVNALVGGSR